MEKITDPKAIKEFLKKKWDEGKQQYFFVLFKPITDICWKTEAGIRDRANDKLEDDFELIVLDRKVRTYYVDEFSVDAKNLGSFHLTFNDSQNIIVVNESYIEYVCNIDGDVEKQIKELQEQVQAEHSETSVLQSTGKKQSVLMAGAKRAAMATAKGLAKNVINGALLGVGKRVSAALQSGIIGALEKAGVPKAVTENEIFRAAILVAAPNTLKVISENFPGLKLEKFIPVHVLDAACISSIADVEAVVLEQVELVLKPILKEIAKLPMAGLSGRKKIKAPASPKELETSAEEVQKEKN